MRARNIKPNYFKNEVLADCDPLARILFTGLWCMADREGRMEYRPKRIKAELLPYDNVKVERLLDQLIKSNFIVLYEVDGYKYLQILTFSKHQNPHCKESVSTIPAPDLHSTNPADSFNLILDSLNPHTEDKQGLSGVCLELFSIFWEAYPKKKNKGEAEKAWKAIKPSNELCDTMLSKLELLKRTDDWRKDDGQYIPYPASWLRKKGWEDEVKKQPNIDMSIY